MAVWTAACSVEKMVVWWAGKKVAETAGQMVARWAHLWAARTVGPTDENLAALSDATKVDGWAGQMFGL